MIRKLKQEMLLRKTDRSVTPLFYLSVFVLLLPVWSGRYFVTGDGPCHLYNASVLLDFVTGQHVSFYESFYSLNDHTDPNWFSHITLAVLLSIFPDYLAEKLFITVYVIGFACALRWLIMVIKPASEFLIFMGLPFIVVYTFQGGFYNYSWSFIFCFLCIAIVMRAQHGFQWHHIVVFTVTNVLLYFTHPIGWFLSTMAIGFLILTWSAKKLKPIQNTSSKIFVSGIPFVLGSLPATALMAEYLARKGLNPIPHSYAADQLLQEFIELRALITMTRLETAWALWIAVLFGVVGIYTIVDRARRGNVQKVDVFFLMFVVTLVIYFVQPGAIAGAGVLSVRLQFIPYLMLLLWYAGSDFDSRFKWFVVVAAILLNAVLVVIRLPVHLTASEAVKEIVSVKDHIHDESVVLPLSFSHNGKTPDGNVISNVSWLFLHAADYLGVEKNLILLGNYEANTGYFPLIWRPEINPFRYLSINEGIEHQPPSVDIAGYSRDTGVKIDYVITWCLDDEFVDHVYTNRILKELSENYSLIYTSKYRRALLYKRK